MSRTESQPATDSGSADAASVEAADARPDVGDILARPNSPAVIRFLGCRADMVGLNADYFTVGRVDGCDLRPPMELGGDASLMLRFSRGAEGWRVSPHEGQPIYVNQEQVRSLTPLRSGDVIRFEPGGAGMQFNIVHQNATPLANLVAKYAPRLLAGDDDSTTPSPRGDDSVVGGMQPLRYEAGGANDATARPLASDEPETGPRIDPALLVAGAIVLAGVIAGGAFLYSAQDFASDEPVEEAPVPSIANPPQTQPVVEAPATEPSPPTPESDAVQPAPAEPAAVDSSPVASAAEQPIEAPAEPPAEPPVAEPSEPASDGDLLDDDPFGL